VGERADVRTIAPEARVGKRNEVRFVREWSGSDSSGNVRDFVLDRGAVAVAGAHLCAAGQCEQTLADRPEDRRVVAERAAGGARPAAEEGVAGEDGASSGACRQVLPGE
jgi:hypothetical protein